MDLKALLEKFDQFAGQAVGQKPGDQVKGTEKAKSGKDHPFKGRLVGASESVLKDLSKGPTPRTKEQELAEEFQAFLEAEFKDTVDKRPGRKSDRHPRGHEPLPRYKTVKADESYMSEKDIELQDYRSMTNQEFQTAYGMSKMEWINQNKALVIQNPDLKRALGLEEAVGQEYTVVIDRKGREKPVSGTMEELLDYFGYTLEVGKSYEHEKGRYKINMAPKNVQQLVDALNKAKSNAAANGHSDTYYSVGQGQVAEGVPYKATNEYPALQDPIIAKVVKQMRPGLGLVGLDMANEAFLYYAYELGKQRARDGWEDYYPAIRQAYMMDKSKQAKELEEGWESGPEEYKEPYDDADDAYDRQRQEKLDIEAEKANAKRPQEKVYTLLGRGPNMEPNYKFPGEYKSQEDAIAAREKIMADPNTPHPEHIGIHSYTRYLDQANEAIDSDIVQPMGQDTFNRAGYNPLRDERDYLDTLSKLTNLSRKPGLDKSMQDHITQRIRDLNAEAFKKGFIKAESRGHKIIATKLKDIERSKKFASGELKIPTPQERQAQLKKLETEPKQVKEYGADNPAQKTSPAQAQQVAANLNVQKTALNQLKQINPEIDPMKAAAAMSKDPATMSPQEKDAAVQVAKTVSPALGTPAFGSLKTAIQKSQVK